MIILPFGLDFSSKLFRNFETLKMVKRNKVGTLRNAQTSVSHEKGHGKPAKKIAPVVARNKRKAIYACNFMKIPQKVPTEASLQFLGFKSTRTEANALIDTTSQRIRKMLDESELKVDECISNKSTPVELFVNDGQGGCFLSFKVMKYREEEEIDIDEMCDELQSELLDSH